LWIYFLKQLQPFGIEFSRHHREPGDVFTWLRQAFDQAGPDWIENESHYDGDGGCRVLGHLCADGTVLDDHLDFFLNKVRDQCRHSIIRRKPQHKFIIARSGFADEQYRPIFWGFGARHLSARS